PREEDAGGGGLGGDPLDDPRPAGLEHALDGEGSQPDLDERIRLRGRLAPSGPQESHAAVPEATQRSRPDLRDAAPLPPEDARLEARDVEEGVPVAGPDEGRRRVDERRLRAEERTLLLFESERRHARLRPRPVPPPPARVAALEEIEKSVAGQSLEGRAEA